MEVGDIFYWNLDDFDMVRPKSIPCKVEKINKEDNTFLAKGKDGIGLLFDMNDIGESLTKKPVFKVYPEDELENYYKVTFISGNSLKLVSMTVAAENTQKAVEKAFNSHGPAFENRLVSVGLTSKPRDKSVER